jgi:DNA processing protein
VVPGPIDSDACLGSNRLLRDGATPVLEAADVLAALGVPWPAAQARPPRAPDRDPRASAVLAALRDGPADCERLARELGLAAPELAAQLLELELEGLVLRTGSRVERRDP